MNINRLQIGALLSFLFASFLLLPAQAQWNQNQYPNSGISRFRWEGVVDGTSFVRIQGRQVRVQTRSGLPVQRQRYEFSDPLPRTPLNVQLVVIDGRDRVRLVEEPRPNNDYTAVVQIDDRSGGRDFYSFELRWQDRDWRDNEGGWSGTSTRNSDHVTWRGRVDGESIIRFRSDRAWEERVNGQGVYGPRYQFSAPLPSHAVNVNLVSIEGRGQILLVEQPTRANNFTAAVLVRDRQGGEGNYAFTLAWEKQPYRGVDHGRWVPPVRDDRNNNGGYGRGVVWSGRVDGRDLIHIRGNQLWVDHREGQAITQTEHRFYRVLPTYQVSINVRRLSGRGDVRVLQQPSPYNNYTAVIQIEDRDHGADFYSLEIDW